MSCGHSSGLRLKSFSMDMPQISYARDPQRIALSLRAFPCEFAFEFGFVLFCLTFDSRQKDDSP